MLRTVGAVGGIARGVFLLVMAAVWGGCAFIVHGNGAPASAAAGIGCLALLCGVGGAAVILRSVSRLREQPDQTEAAAWKWREEDLAHEDAKDRADALISKYMRDRSSGDAAADQGRTGPAPAFGRAVR